MSVFKNYDVISVAVRNIIVVRRVEWILWIEQRYRKKNICKFTFSRLITNYNKFALKVDALLVKEQL